MKNDISGGVRRLIGKVTRSRIAKKFSGLWFTCVPSFAIKRSAFGVACYFDSRDTVAYWLMTRSALESERISSILGSGSGLAWDVGCNIGIYSLLMASRGRPVVAFDLSAKAVKLLNKSAKANGFRNIIGVARALSVAPIKYANQPTARLGNKIEPGDDKEALTFEEAATLYGIPSLIKMDIEGHEEAFLKSPSFKKWLLENHIAWVVEIHKPEYKALFWDDVSTEEIEPSQYLINA